MSSEDKTEPKCTEVLCSASVGGKVQIVKFEYSQDYHFSMSRKYDVPEDWTEQDVNDFQVAKEVEIRGVIEGLAETEVEELMKMRDEAN